jgi:hypothetical protein
LPGPIDTNSADLVTVLNKTAAKSDDLVTGQSNVNTIVQAKEVQFHVVIVCVFVCFVFLF